MVFVDDFIDDRRLATDEFKKHYKVEEDEIYGVYDIIDMLKEKYNIKEIVEHRIDWR